MSNRLQPNGDVRQWPLAAGINVVLFSAMGGSCDGLEQAGHPVHIAINHDPVAVAVHAWRHPHTKHFQSDVFDVCPRDATRGRPVNILWASPDCRHFSRAKGGAPVSTRVRSLPWVVCRWAGQVRPSIIFTENVTELRTWGPLVAKRDKASGRVLKIDGTVAEKGERVPRHEQQLVPDARRKGRTFHRWQAHLRALGYSVEDADLCCADYGIPTTRTRFVQVARADGRPIVWPERTHAPRDSEDVAQGRLQPWRGAWEIINWSLPVKSIFGRPKPLAENTERRIAAGLVRFVINAPQPFILPVTHSGDARAWSIEDPLRTVTSAKRGEFALVAPAIISFYGTKEGRDLRGQSLEDPLRTVTGGKKHALVTAWLAQHNTGMVGHDPRQPLSTIIGKGSTQALCAAYMVKLRGTSKDGQDIGVPMPSITAGGNHTGLVAAFITKYYGEGSVAQDCRDPLHTVVTKARMGLVTAPVDGGEAAIYDIGMRMFEPEELGAAHEFPPDCFPERVTLPDGKVRTITKEIKVGFIGNSVPPRLARILAECNSAAALAVAEAAE